MHCRMVNNRVNTFTFTCICLKLSHFLVEIAYVVSRLDDRNEVNKHEYSISIDMLMQGGFQHRHLILQMRETPARAL